MTSTRPFTNGRVLVWICILMVLACVGVQTSDARQAKVSSSRVAEQLRRVAVERIEPLLSEAFDYERKVKKNPDKCFHPTTDAATKGKASLRVGCCTYVANFAAAALELMYKDTEDGLEIGSLTFERVLPDFMRWGVRSDKIQDVLEAPLSISVPAISGGGVEVVSGRLLKCNFDDVHMYIVFTSPQMDQDLILDFSYKQYFVLPDLTDESMYTFVQEHKMFVRYDDFFIGTDAEIAVLWALEPAVQVTELLYLTQGKKTPANAVGLGSLRTAIYGNELRSKVCGKPYGITKLL